MQIEIPDLEDVVFENSCDHCFGSGFVGGNANGGSCPDCNGTGVVMSKVGARLIQFLKNHGLVPTKTNAGVA